MRLFKLDYVRFFALGFAAGAVLVFATVDGPFGNELANGVVPAAQAAPSQ